MRPTDIRDGIVARLRKDIEEEIYPPSSALPSENQLAANFGVARGTIRSVLAVLEKEKLIRKVNGRGTFVRPKARRQNKTVYYILPCPDYMLKCGYPSLRGHLKAIAGALRAVNELGGELVTLPITLDNNSEHPDLQSLAKIRSDSRVFISTADWYRPMLGHLQASGAKIAGTLFSPELRPLFSDRTKYLFFYNHAANPYERIVSYFANKGITNLLFASEWEDGKDKLLRKAYEKYNLSFAPERNLLKLPFQDAASATTVLRKHCSRFKFDGLFLRSATLPIMAHETMNAVLELPENLHITIHPDSECNRLLKKASPVYELDSEQLAYEGTRWLLGNSSGGIRMVHAEFRD